jgi:cytochrome c-type biogenesis protein CcmH
MQLIPEKSAGIYLALANAVAMQNGGVISGRPEELVKDALELDSQSAVGLWMAGMAAEEGGRLDEALAYWKRAEPLLAGQPTNQQELRGMMRRVAEQLGSIITFEDSAIQAPSPANSADVINSPGPALQQPSGIKVSVAIDPDLMSSVDPSSTIFVFAKAVSGPPMPLAVVRMQVKDLPAEIMLDDTMAMMPQMKISLFDQVSVSAKISASGVATPQADDINSEAVTVATIDSPSIDLLIR